MSSTFLVSQQQSRSCCEHYIHSCMFCALYIMYLFLLHASNVLKMSVFLLGIARSNRKCIFKNKWMEMLLLIHTWILIQNSAPEAPTPHIYPHIFQCSAYHCTALKVQPSIRTGEKGKKRKLSTSETVDLLEFFHTSIYRVHKEWQEKDKTSS